MYSEETQGSLSVGRHILTRSGEETFDHPMPRAARAAARAACGSAAVRAASAARRHSSSVTVPRREPTPATAEAAQDKELIPNPTSTQASTGSAAASPQTPTG